MTGLLDQRSQTKYSAFTTQRTIPQASTYEPIDIYNTNSTRNLLTPKEMSWREWFSVCCCCKKKSLNITTDTLDNPNSSLVGRIGRSYNLNQEIITQQPYPILTVTRTINNDISAPIVETDANFFSKKEILSTTSNFLNQERSIPANTHTGEKSFLREIISCRDSFLKSLEWYDNSLTRGKKCRYIKRDEWAPCDVEGIQNPD